MKYNRIQPTLQGDYGDLNTEIPPLYIEGLKEFFITIRTIHPRTNRYRYFIIWN